MNYSQKLFDCGMNICRCIKTEYNDTDSKHCFDKVVINNKDKYFYCTCFLSKLAGELQSNIFTNTKNSVKPFRLLRDQK